LGAKGIYNGDILAVSRRINVEVKKRKMKKKFAFS
jgi:hypothetical protein